MFWLVSMLCRSAARRKQIECAKNAIFIDATYAAYAAHIAAAIGNAASAPTLGKRLADTVRRHLTAPRLPQITHRRVS